MPAADYEGFEAGDDTVIWRYMSLPRLRSLFNDGLYFAAAHQFDDTFEGAIADEEVAARRAWAERVYPDDPGGREEMFERVSGAFADLRRMMKISCWHCAEIENIAMWERYLPDGAPGVAIQSTVGQLKAALHPFRLMPEYGEERIFVGAVRYIDYRSDGMLDRHERGVFLHKRAEYRDEREIRAILSLRVAAEFNVSIPTDGVLVDIDRDVLVSGVRVRPPAALEEVRQLVARAGLECPVEPSGLDTSPTY